MVNLLVVGLQDELAEGAAAVSVNLEEFRKKSKMNKHLTALHLVMNCFY